MRAAAAARTPGAVLRKHLSRLAILRGSRTSITPRPLMPTCQVLVNKDNCVIAYIKDFLTSEEQRDLFVHLRDNIEWRVETDDFGPQDRKSFYMADDGCVFKYVGLRLEPNRWMDEVSQIKERANTLVKPLLNRLKLDKNSEHGVTACLINNYEEGGAFIPWHFDEVRAHGEAKIVLSVSLGGARAFELRRSAALADYADENDHEHERVEVGVEGGKKAVRSGCEIISLDLAPGSALLMAGDTQSHWLHQLPLSDGHLPHRISLTFRSIVAGFENQLAEQEKNMGIKSAMDNCIDN